MAIKIGPAGSGGSSEQGFIDIKEAGLDAVEIEFTYGVWMTPKKAKEIAELNKRLKLGLSIHAPYYINLNSKEKAKVEASKKRILKCCEIGDLVGAKHIVFHPGFYMGMDKDLVYENIKKQVKELMKTIKEKKYNVILCPETTGKVSQFGDLEDLIRLKKETGCHLCIDFAHLKARYQGKIKFEDVVKKIKGLGHIHAHFAGIEWGDKGERKHLLTPEKDLKELLTALKKHKIDITIINESPDPFGDAIKTKKIREKLK